MVRKRKHSGEILPTNGLIRNARNNLNKTKYYIPPVPVTRCDTTVKMLADNGHQDKFVYRWALLSLLGDIKYGFSRSDFGLNSVAEDGSIIIASKINNPMKRTNRVKKVDGRLDYIW